MENSVDGYFTPGSLALPAWLSPEERREAMEILDEIEQALEGAGGEDYQSTLEGGQAFVARLNESPARLRSYARLHTGLPITSAIALFDGLSTDGKYLLSFQLDLHESDTDEGDAGGVNGSAGSNNTSA